MKSFISAKTMFRTLGFFVFALSAFSLVAQNPGQRDTSFHIGTAMDYAIDGVHIMPNGKIFVAGDFTQYNGQAKVRIALLQPNGALDPTFTANTTLGANADVRATYVQPNGYILIGGLFSQVNGAAHPRLARLKGNGVIDTSFQIGTGPNNEVTAIAGNGQRIAISGFFSQYNGTARQGFAFLLNSGALDPNFTIPTWASQIWSQYVYANNKVLIGGNFSSFQNAPFNRIARLNADGSLDTSFNPGTGASASIEAITVQPNGKILLGGGFTTFNGQPHVRLVRLNANGSIDTTFHAQLGFNTTVRGMSVYPNGKILVSGMFTTFNGVSTPFLVRLNADGTGDQSFVVGTGFNGNTAKPAIQADGKVVIAGNFTQYQGVSARRIIRLEGDTGTTPVVPIFSQPQYTATCFGDTVVLEITGGNISAADHWEWRINDCLSSLLDTGLTVKFAPQSDTTTFAVRSSGNAACATVQLVVADTVPPQLLITLPTLTDYCEVIINPQSAPVATDFCTGQIVGVPQGPLTYATPGSHWLPWLFDDGHGNTSVYIQQIDVLPIDTSVVSLGNFQWMAAHASSTAKYLWMECLGNQRVPLPNDTLQTFFPPYNGEFAVVVTEGNCADTSSCHEMVAWRVDEFATNSLLKIYPNPATSEVLLRYDATLGIGQLSLLTLNGQVLRSEEIIPNTNHNLNIEHLPKGVYLVQIKTANANLTQRLVKL